MRSFGSSDLRWRIEGHSGSSEGGNTGLFGTTLPKGQLRPQNSWYCQKKAHGLFITTQSESEWAKYRKVTRPARTSVSPVPDLLISHIIGHYRLLLRTKCFDYVHILASQLQQQQQNLYFNWLQWDFTIYFKAAKELMRLPTAAYISPPAKCWSAVPAAYQHCIVFSVFLNEECGFLSVHMLAWINHSWKDGWLALTNMTPRRESYCHCQAPRTAELSSKNL